MRLERRAQWLHSEERRYLHLHARNDARGNMQRRQSHRNEVAGRPSACGRYETNVLRIRDVDITIKASSKEDADKVSSAMTEENLNTHCANHGLAKATMVTAPTVQRAQAFGYCTYTVVSGVGCRV